MAKLQSPLLPHQVARFKGVLDYYIQRGQPIVRSWPKKSKRVQNPAERLAQCQLFGALQAYRCAPAWYTERMSTILNGYTWTRRDYFMSFYLNPVNGNLLPGHDHHPPQPPVCPGGDGHYWSLLDAYAEEFGFFNKRLFFVFDQPLRYQLWFVRRPSNPFTLEGTLQGVTHPLAPLSPLEPAGLEFVGMTAAGPNTYQLDFNQLPGNEQIGVWWAYIRAFHPTTLHPSISLSPWFQFTIPARTELTPTRPASGITLIGQFTGEVFDPLSSTREPRALDSYADCRFPTIH